MPGAKSRLFGANVNGSELGGATILNEHHVRGKAGIARHQKFRTVHKSCTHKGLLSQRATKYNYPVSHFSNALRSIITTVHSYTYFILGHSLLTSEGLIKGYAVIQRQTLTAPASPKISHSQICCLYPACALLGYRVSVYDQSTWNVATKRSLRVST